MQHETVASSTIPLFVTFRSVGVGDLLSHQYRLPLLRNSLRYELWCILCIRMDPISRNAGLAGTGRTTQPPVTFLLPRVSGTVHFWKKLPVEIYLQALSGCVQDIKTHPLTIIPILCPSFQDLHLGRATQAILFQ